jgi:2-iminoacetate synthase
MDNMSFADQTIHVPDFNSITAAEVERALARENSDLRALAALLSPAAASYLEPMARRAHALTLRYFGRTIQLFTPMYLANFCENHCRYCGFSADNAIKRKRLTREELEREAAYLAQQEFAHVLILTGSSRSATPVQWIAECVSVLNAYFPSISIEVYSLTQDEYRQLVEAGADGLTIYQETYNRSMYAYLHPAGPKADYEFRLLAPERGAAAGMRTVNIGALLGLDDWRGEVFTLAMHAHYLQTKYPAVEVGVSFPRIRPHEGSFTPACDVSDAELVQIITAFRIFLPRVGITVSTRESAVLRENLLPLGVTRISAGSSTAVGGRTTDSDQPDQFAIADERSLHQIKEMLRGGGYQAVHQDWMRL